MKPFVTGLLLFLAVSSFAWCAEPAITGTVTDSLGAVIPGASVVLMQAGKDVSTTTTDAAGKFKFTVDSTGRYSVRPKRSGSSPRTAAPRSSSSSAAMA